MQAYFEQPRANIPGGYSEFQLTGMIEWGQKSKPKKSLGLSPKPQKIPGPKINPQKIPSPNFRALESSRQANATINSKVQLPPPRVTPWAFELLKIGLFKFPPLAAKKAVQMPTN